MSGREGDECPSGPAGVGRLGVESIPVGLLLLGRGKGGAMPRVLSGFVGRMPGKTGRSLGHADAAEGHECVHDGRGCVVGGGASLRWVRQTNDGLEGKCTPPGAPLRSLSLQH